VAGALILLEAFAVPEFPINQKLYAVQPGRVLAAAASVAGGPDWLAPGGFIDSRRRLPSSAVLIELPARRGRLFGPCPLTWFYFDRCTGKRLRQRPTAAARPPEYGRADRVVEGHRHAGRNLAHGRRFAAASSRHARHPSTKGSYANDGAAPG